MATRDWSTLPDTALVSILSAVHPSQQRLKCCALVSTSWAAAAVVATREICLSNSADPQSVHATLSSSYSSIRSLQIDSGPKQLLSDFPALPGLQELQLLQARVQLGPGSSTHGILHAVTALTHLLLHEVTLPAGLQAVSVLRSLRSLSVVDCMQPSCPAGRLPGAPSTADASTAEYTEPAPVPGSLFSQLLQLSYLELRGGLSASSLQYISRLTNLDSLALDFEGSDASPAAVRGLDRLQGLTFLALTDADVDISSDMVPGLSRLAGLDTLWLYNCRSIDPLLLAPLTKLQHLDLDSTPPAGGSKGAAVLLSVLPKLQHLTHLDLCDCLMDNPAAPAAAYAALTTSPQLAYLDIQGAEAPADAWQHILPAARQLPQLQRLHLAGVFAADGLSADQLQLLVQTCPGIEHLQCWLEPEVLPTALLQLSALTALALSAVTDEVAGAVLLKLPALQELHIVPDSSIDDVGLLRLTALTRLSQLGIHHDACSPEFAAQYSKLAVKDGEDFVLVFDVEDYPPDFPRDVWLQLLKCCARSPKCRVPLNQQYDQLRQQLSQAEQQLQNLRLEVQRYQGGGRNRMVEVQLQAAELRQQAALGEVAMLSLETAVAVVRDALLGSGEPGSGSLYDLLFGLG